jgi:uncharacterized protein
LASKRHQHSIFAPNNPGFDPREAMRHAQADMLALELSALAGAGENYLLTGDFNDFDFSETIRRLTADHSVNLIERIPRAQRFDYNHRGKLHMLMHAIVSKRQAQGDLSAVEILHGNELIGVKPGSLGQRATDHAYVLTHLKLQQDTAHA